MSTKFTTSVEPNDATIESECESSGQSRCLQGGESDGTPPEPLTVLLQKASQSILRSLREALAARGYDEVSESHLILFGNLDCGATYAAAIAQRMSVSRQAISRTLRELEQLGFVRLEDDAARRNQKLVVMTGRGRRLALDARDELARIEDGLARDMGRELAGALRAALERGWGQGR
jgi:DNA-binding MarR family transcriptional regulator